MLNERARDNIKVLKSKFHFVKIIKIIRNTFIIVRNIFKQFFFISIIE